MIVTHEALLAAVREAGRKGEFSSADVRQHLGLSTKDRGQLTRFQNQFRAFQKAAPEQIEKVGKNLFRLPEQGAPIGQEAVSLRVAEPAESPISVRLAAASDPLPELASSVAPLEASKDPLPELQATDLPRQVATAPQPELPKPAPMTLLTRERTGSEDPGWATLEVTDEVLKAALTLRATDDFLGPDTATREASQATARATAAHSWRNSWLGRRVAELLGRASA